MDFSRLKGFIDYIVKDHFPGSAINVCLRGENVFSYAAGYADLETKRPFTCDDYVYIYSCSKVATAVAGCQLLERGKFLLNEPLYEYMPEYKDMTVLENDGTLREATRPILIGDLFSMSAGFDYDFGCSGVVKAGELTDGKFNTIEVARQLATDPLVFDPGEHWKYSLCHDVLGGFIEVITGKKFRDYVKENIFDPLGMTHSFYHVNDDILENMASQYSFVPTGENTDFDIVEAQKYGTCTTGTFVNVGKKNKHILGDEYDSGGAGIISTANDYVKLATALAMGGRGANGEYILSPHTIELMKVNRLNAVQQADFNWPAMRGYGYGLGVRTHINKALSGSLSNLGEFGWGGAAASTVICDTDIGLSVFIAQHCLNPREAWYQPRLRNVIYGCLKD